MSSRRRVLITGRGCISGLGQGLATSWEAIAAGRSAIRPLRRVVAAVEVLDDVGLEDDEREARYAEFGDAFAALFPGTDDGPFGSLLALLPDPDYPYLDFHIEFGEPDAAGQVRLFLSGEQFGVEVAANLIQRCAPSALPFGFEWASDCDRLRAGEFGGGYVVITHDDMEYGNTSQLLDRAITRERDEGADGYVLATRDRAHGLGFWNDRDGFGRLAAARIFTEAEAAMFDIPLADDQPERLTMPAPLRL